MRTDEGMVDSACNLNFGKLPGRSNRGPLMRSAHRGKKLLGNGGRLWHIIGA